MTKKNKSFVFFSPSFDGFCQNKQQQQQQKKMIKATVKGPKVTRQNVIEVKSLENVL